MDLLSFFRRGAHTAAALPLYFFNTLHKKKEEFTPPPWKTVRMYNCGPTVYGRQHIGNLSMFVFADVLRRALEYNGYAVEQVINFTDFGHLSGDNDGDADIGEDRMSKGLKREGLALTMANMKVLGEKYANLFLEDISALNIDTSRITFPRASDHIPGQIAMIATLLEKSYAYTGKHGVYFDTSQFSRYGELGAIDLAGLKEGARVSTDTEKRNPTDFLLWKSDKKLGWDSPWGKGFPGWHIECSAMIRATLGEQIDIHTGGIEHIAIHHNNEIAQSESTTGKRPLSRFWLHRAHIQIEGGKIAKSKGAVIYLSDIVERGFHPLSLRYLFLSAHYRTSMNFTWESLAAAQTAYGKLLALRESLRTTARGTPSKTWLKIFHECINDDLDTAGALAALWAMIRDDSLAPEVLLANILDADRVFGLGLETPDEKALALAAPELRAELQIADLPDDIRQLISERETARQAKEWERADALRTKLADLGYSVEDATHGPRIFEM